MDSLVKKLTAKEVKVAIKTLPKGSDAYDEAYSAAMERICAQGKESSEMAKKILSWILCACRPLSTQELLHALAVDFNNTEIDDDMILDTEQILNICAGLVTIDEQSESVRFIHYTTQEYLQRNRETWLPQAGLEIARTCTAYLSIDNLSVGPCTSKKEYDRRVETLWLLDYAAVHWGPHMNVLAEGDYVSKPGYELKEKAMLLLCNTRNLSSASQALFMSGKEYVFSGDTVAQEGEAFSGIHWIGRFGLTALFKPWSLRSSAWTQWDYRDSSGRTPLSWAAGAGHEELSKLLLGTGKVEADSSDHYCRTPLSWASRNGQETTVELLLERKVDVNSKDYYDQTPLLLATQNGQEAVVKQLLSTNNVKVDSRDSSGWTPLLWAIRRKDEAIVKLLLDTGQADVESKSKHGETPLSWAIKKGNEAIVKLLLDSGKVDTEYKNEDGQTLLSLASESGQDAIVMLLLETRNTDINSKDGYGQTPLLLATKNKRETVVKLLLDTGKVDIDAKDGSGKTPLAWASRSGQEVVVQLLLDTGRVDVNSVDINSWTPLRYANERGYEVIAKLLQDTGKAVPHHHR